MKRKGRIASSLFNFWLWAWKLNTDWLLTKILPRDAMLARHMLLSCVHRSDRLLTRFRC